MLESVSFAFLLALEALTPLQRAVLLLRDVFDYTTAETAEALDVSEASTKVTLLRARRRMREYDKNREGMTAERRDATRRALEQFLLLLQTRDIENLERLLADDVVSVSDSGGEVNAATRVVFGRDRVARLVLGLAGKQLRDLEMSFKELNGLPAVLCTNPAASGRSARRFTLHLELDGSGRIRRIDTVLAPKKLTAVSG
jgi:RNA polymerase sigma-70 factor (ECF subfamily)